MTDDPTPSWLGLSEGEVIRWQDSRRTRAIILTALGAAPFVLVGIALAVGVLPGTSAPVLTVGGLLLAFGALTTVGLQLLAIRNTDYVATDQRLYRKGGILSLRVTTVDYETVQNVTYSQTITGTLFDHGTLSFDTAGGSGTELSFQDIDDPRPVERLVNEALSQVRGDSDETVPGTTQQWEAVLDEVRAIRRSLETP